MDQFIQKALEGEFFWLDSVPVLNQSAFVPYRPEAAELQKPAPSGPNPMNMNKKMMQFLRKRCPPSKARTEIGECENGNERGFRHMINERMRREKQKQSYLALHSLLPNGTKSDKNWIVQMATANIQQLQRCKEELRNRNMKLAAILGNERSVKWSRIRLRVPNPTSGVDSLLEVLKCLQNLGVKTRNIHSSFSPQEFSAEMEIETKIGAAVVETAMQQTLCEAERKLLSSSPAAGQSSNFVTPHC